MKTTFKYDHYYKYDEIKSNLEYFTNTYPDLCELTVNTETPEKRNQYLLTITNKKTGEALYKPALYVDGNIHAGEVTSSMASMHMIDYLLTNYESEEEIQELLDNTTIYVIPRVSPDGAEHYLTTPFTYRSTNQPHKPEAGGIDEVDLDNDGVIRMMRIPSAYGAWKIDPNDNSSMVLRSPSDIKGEFYDIYPEGVLEEYDGLENLKSKKMNYDMDFNRNVPYYWFNEARQVGAGDYPLSAVETKAIVDFALSHQNICGACLGHTSGGIILYPPGVKETKDISYNDSKRLKALANMGKEELDYKPVNIFESFISDKSAPDSGALDDWFFGDQGVPAFTVEYWDINKKAGVPIDWEKYFKEEPTERLERFNACMKWVKENAKEYYKDWEEYDNPTFGKVEVGGFNYKFTHQNPPENLLLNECEGGTRFYLRFAKALPHIVIDEVETNKVDEGIYEVNVIVGNTSYLPTNLTDEAFKAKVNKPIIVKCDGGELISGKREEKIESLAGYSETDTGVYYYGNLSTEENAKARKKLTYIVKAKAGDSFKIYVEHPKAGKAYKELTFE